MNNLIFCFKYSFFEQNVFFSKKAKKKKFKKIKFLKFNWPPSGFFGAMQWLGRVRYKYPIIKFWYIKTITAGQHM